MARGIRFKPSYPGYRALMAESGIQGMVGDAAEKIASRATSMLSGDWGAPPEEDHFMVEDWTGPRFGAKGRMVFTHTEHARRSQSRNKTLTKALNSTEV